MSMNEDKKEPNRFQELLIDWYEFIDEEPGFGIFISFLGLAFGLFVVALIIAAFITAPLGTFIIVMGVGAIFGIIAALYYYAKKIMDDDKIR